MGLHNLARMTTATTGTGTITLGSPVLGYIDFATSGVVNGETVTYGIVDGTSSEVGHGVYTASTLQLTRSVITSTGSGGNTLLSLSGNAQVFLTVGSGDMLYPGNNLSDLPSAATARTNLGLGTAALATTGTAVGNVPVIGAGGTLPSSIMPPAAFFSGGDLAANYVVVAGDAGKEFWITATAAITITLPQPGTVPADFFVSFTTMGSSGQSVTFTCATNLLNRGISQSQTNEVITQIKGATITWHNKDQSSWVTLVDEFDTIPNSITTSAGTATATGFKIASGADLAAVFNQKLPITTIAPGSPGGGFSWTTATPVATLNSTGTGITITNNCWNCNCNCDCNA